MAKPSLQDVQNCTSSQDGRFLHLYWYFQDVQKCTSHQKVHFCTSWKIALNGFSINCLHCRMVVFTIVCGPATHTYHHPTLGWGPHTTCHHANHWGWSSARPCGIKGVAAYDDNNNCVTYLTHPPILLLMVSTLTLGKDNEGRTATVAMALS